MINIIGLAVGMACSILILLWVLDIEFDKFHDKVYDIYVLRQTQYHANGAQRTSPSLPGLSLQPWKAIFLRSLIQQDFLIQVNCC